MSVYLESIQIKNLFDEKNINWKFNDVSVLVGKNGAGKSTILRSIYELLSESEGEHLSLSTECNLNFVNNSQVSFKKNKLNFSKPEIETIISIMAEQTKKQKPGKKQKKELIEFNTSILNLYNKIKSKSDKIESMYFTEINRVNENAIKDISIEMISTINMSANSINELKKSDGNTTTLLDMELTSEIEKLLSQKNSDGMSIKIKTFTEELNSFYDECNKSISFNDEGIQIKNKKNGKKIRVNQLSSGERQLLFILIKSLNNSCTKNILLMDEPEISLHMSWQKKLISSIKKINENCQLIIVTHSASILAKGWMNSFVDIKEIESKVI